jgi:hypothetical protein
MLADWQKTVVAALIGARLLSPGMAHTQTAPGAVPTATVTQTWDGYAAALRDWHAKRQIMIWEIEQMRNATGLRVSGVDEKQCLQMLTMNPNTTREEKAVLKMIAYGAYHNFSAKTAWDKANQDYLARVRIVDGLVGPPPVPPKR